MNKLLLGLVVLIGVSFLLFKEFAPPSKYNVSDGYVLPEYSHYKLVDDRIYPVDDDENIIRGNGYRFSSGYLIPIDADGNRIGAPRLTPFEMYFK